MPIIGLGNSHGGDDAAGILVARGVASRGIESMEQEGSPLDLIEMWQATDSVIVIDAVSSGCNPGTIHIWDVSVADLSKDVFRSSTHAFGLAEIVRLARTLDRLPKRLTIYGIEAARFEAGAPPSPAVLEAVERVIDQIVSRVAGATTSS
jgi:hydrogenase maturation protease